MADREKVIKGLFACAYKDCRSCPYWGTGSHGSSACKTLAADALALLKEQEKAIKYQSDRLDELLDKQQPRVMALEEVKALAEDDLVWYEHVGINRLRPRVIY